MNRVGEGEMRVRLRVIGDVNRVGEDCRVIE